MVRIPKSVVIGGMLFRIVMKKMDDWGEMDFEDREIRLSLNAADKPQILVDTLKHEMLHASLSVAGLSWSEKYDEEPIVRAIENIFFPALRTIQHQLPHGL